MASQYDQSYKLTTDEDARGSLALVAGIPIPLSAIVESLERELNLERLHADHLYRVRNGFHICLHHFEALTHYRSDWTRAQVDHAVYAWLKYRLPLESHLLLLQERGAPANIRNVILEDAGKLVQNLEVNIIRLWERPASEVLKSDSVALYPWTALMDATVEQQREAARRIQVSGREGLRLQMALLGTLRYGSRESFFERIGHMLLSKEILRETPLWQEIEQEAQAEGLAKGMETGLAKGLATGLAEGKAEGARQALLWFLNSRFGPVPDWATQQVAAADLATLERWIGNAGVADSLSATFH